MLSTFVCIIEVTYSTSKEKKGATMASPELEEIKSKLLAMRREIFQHLHQLENGWQELADRDIEFEEEAQKAELSELFAHLDNRQKEELEDIDDALAKIANLTYGKCESCGKTIPMLRLLATPATRLCFDCNRREEEKKKIPPALA